VQGSGYQPGLAFDDEPTPDGSPEAVPSPAVEDVAVEPESEGDPLPQHAFGAKADMLPVAVAMDALSPGFYRAIIAEAQNAGSGKIWWGSFAAVAAERGIVSELGEARAKVKAK
jgi:hypothetical protein